MSKRATLIHTGEGGPQGASLHVLYCRYSGRHALSTDCDLSKAPRRKTDGCLVVDTEFYTTKLYTKDGAVKRIRQKNGTVERQIRITVGDVPIGYWSELGGRFLYIYHDALSSYSGANGGETTRRPVPPCITKTPDGHAEVNLEIEDKAPQAGLTKISREHVKVQIMQTIAHDKAAEEILETMRLLLGGREGQLSLARGMTARQKVLKVQGLSPEAIFERLEASL